MTTQKRLRDPHRVSGQGRIRERMSNLQEVIGNLDIHADDRNNYQDEDFEEGEGSERFNRENRLLIAPSLVRKSRVNNMQLNKEFTLDPTGLSRYLTDKNKGIEQCLAKLDSFEFDIFSLKRISTGKELIILGYEIAV
jgi:hypothetical protein